MPRLNKDEVEECLDHLRAADALLMKRDELAVAVHLALVIELLEQRQAQAVSAETGAPA